MNFKFRLVIDDGRLWRAPTQTFTLEGDLEADSVDEARRFIRERFATAKADPQILAGNARLRSEKLWRVVEIGRDSYGGTFKTVEV